MTDPVRAMTIATPCASCGEPPIDGCGQCEGCGAPVAAAAMTSTRPGADAPTASSPTVSSPTAPEPEPESLWTLICAQCRGIIEDGYCRRCGSPAAKPRDHFSEQPAAWLAGVSDRGIRHSRNEDALALAAGAVPSSHGVMVVCDGVSTAASSDAAALAAARAARAVLDDVHAVFGEDASARLVRAVEAANTAAGGVQSTGEGEPEYARHDAAACTFVAATITQGEILVANVGDSRAYWLGDDGSARLLTTDDSVAQVQIAAGVDRATAEAGPHAHAITAWLGADAPELSVTPVPLRPTGDGWLLLCSDGLWNYASDPQQLVELVLESALAGVHDPRDLAARLTQWAWDQGGRDNITVALARFGTRQQVSALQSDDDAQGTTVSDDASGQGGHTGPQNT